MIKTDNKNFNRVVVTKNEVVEGLKELKVMGEELLVVYGEIPQSNYLIGGEQTFIEALYEVLGFQSTVVMPAHVIKQDCPSFFDETLPDELLSIVKKHSPAFNLEGSEINSGKISEMFALNKQVVRSSHPVASFLALGQKAVWLMGNHHLDSMFGVNSPMQKLYAQGAKVLCLGTDYEEVTAFHFMEYLANCRDKKVHEAVIIENGDRKLVKFEDLALDSTVFKEIGRHYEQSKDILKTTIGNIECRLIDYQDFINFGVNYITEQRKMS